MNFDKEPKAAGEPKAFTVDREDKNAAYQEIGEALKAKDRLLPHFARPDDSLTSPTQETTSTVEQTQKDYREIKAIVESHDRDLGDLRVLEVGSGMGLLLQEFARHDVNAIGIDMNPRDYWLRDKVQEVENHPLGALRPEQDKAGQFGLIVAKNVFDDDRYMFQKYDEMLAHISSLLEAGGIFIKMGTGHFADSDIPSDLQRIDGGTKSFFGTEVYQKV